MVVVYIASQSCCHAVVETDHRAQTVLVLETIISNYFWYKCFCALETSHNYYLSVILTYFTLSFKVCGYYSDQENTVSLYKLTTVLVIRANTTFFTIFQVTQVQHYTIVEHGLYQQRYGCYFAF